MILLNSGDRYFPSLGTATGSCLKLALTESSTFQCVHPICWGPKPKRQDQDKGRRWSPMVFTFPGISKQLFPHDPVETQSDTRKMSWGRAAPCFCRMLCGILVHLGQKWGGDGAHRGTAVSSQTWHFYRVPPPSFLGWFVLPPPTPKQRFKLNLYLSLQIEVLTKEKIGFSQNVFPSDSSQISKSCFSLGKLTSNSFLILPTTVTVRKAFLVDYIIIFFLTRSTLH